MVYALIKNSRVINVINADVAFVNNLISRAEIDEAILIQDDVRRPNPGDHYDNGAFSLNCDVNPELSRGYQCLACSQKVDSIEEVRQHSDSNADHVFVRIYW